MDTAPYVVSGEPTAERVADDVWLLMGRPRYKFNAYVLGDVLVDARTRHAARSILRQLEGVSLSAHVLTHAHLDHMGASHEVCERLGLPLLCGDADRAVAESGCRLGLDQRPSFVRLEHRLLAGPGHPVSGTLGEGDVVGGFTVLETPGHSPGHLAFWRESDRVLVLGDVLFNVTTPLGRTGLMLAPAVMTPDPDQNLRSAQRLAALEPSVICFGHGPPLRDGERFQRFVGEARYDSP
jgi:glyoxylase-like metal-dependent hydrolase (beta-lactamase superfamily II)